MIIILPSILDVIKEKIIISDGAMGTMLQKSGLKVGQIPESFNVLYPDVVENIHKEYINSGSMMITTNTFGASPLKLKGTGYTSEEIIISGINCAKRAANNKVYVAFDIGPLGELLYPMGSLSQSMAYDYFKEQVIIAKNNCADIILIETMTDLAEAKMACLAAKENCDLPVICTMSFEESGRTFTGCSPSAAALTLSPLADIIGVNCSLGPDKLINVVREFLEFSSVPIAVSPNAGLPVIKDEKVIFDVSPESFAESVSQLVDLGVSFIGGCCGTTPAHIQKLFEVFNNKCPKVLNREIPCAVCTPTKTVVINKPCIIGERINPTGKKRLKQALLENDYNYILEQAVSQIDAGADILDINTGLPEIDEETMLCNVIQEITAVTNIPLQIDSSNPSAIEKALRTFTGKAIVNSVNGENNSMNEILPLVKKYGAAVVILTLDESGIPKTAEERITVAKKVVDEALKLGIPKRDLFIDCLTLTVSAQQKEAVETLKAVRMVKEQLGLKTVLGVSNISFGLPCRENINETFLAQALCSGLDLPIINPNSAGMMKQVYCHNVINNIDINAEKYISLYSDEKQGLVQDYSSDMSLISIVENGYKDKAEHATKLMLNSTNALDIVDNYLIPALDKVGEKYEKGIIFLPQLIRSAETVKVAFECLKQTMPKNKQINKGTIILATVKGDIHDIGKNIVKVILENYGFKVIDLGRDVPPETIVNSAVENNVSLVGLSALMTTTVKSMETTIKMLKNVNQNIVTMVGGAVLNADYAKMIGADYYAKDAKASAEFAKKHFKED